MRIYNIKTVLVVLMSLKYRHDSNKKLETQVEDVFRELVGIEQHKFLTVRIILIRHQI